MHNMQQPTKCGTHHLTLPQVHNGQTKPQTTMYYNECLFRSNTSPEWWISGSHRGSLWLPSENPTARTTIAERPHHDYTYYTQMRYPTCWNSSYSYSLFPILHVLHAPVSPKFLVYLSHIPQTRLWPTGFSQAFQPRRTARRIRRIDANSQVWLMRR